MKITKRLLLLFSSSAILLLIVAVFATNYSSAKGAAPVTINKVQIKISEPGGKANTLTATKTNEVSQLYVMMTTLPKAKPDRICSSEVGKKYELAFFDNKTIKTIAYAERYSCQIVTIGKTDRRVASTAFWKQLDKVVKSAPLVSVQPDRVEITIVKVASKSNTVVLVGRDLAQKLYSATYTLPRLPAGSACPDIAGTVYHLKFLQGGTTLTTVKADRSGCGTVTYKNGEVHLANKNFWSLLNQATGKQ